MAKLSMAKKHCVVSLSGGMDSSTLLLRALTEYDTVTGISFDYGQKHRVELERAQQLVDYLADKGHKVNYRQIKLDGYSSLHDGDEFEPPNFENFTVVEGPSQSIAYRASSYSKSYTYVLSPLKEGSLNVGESSTVIDDKIYRTSVLKINVNKKIISPINDLFFDWVSMVVFSYICSFK